MQAFAQTALPFSRGINLTGWFQAGNAYQIQAGQYTHEDFQQIKSLGCDVIRLPINLHAMTSGFPDYRLEPLFLEFLDQAVDYAESLGLYLILDNHTFDPAKATNPNIGPILETVWTQMATHYKDRSELIIYEVLNEPHGISDQQWNTIQMGVVDAIRAVDQDHYIIIGPAGWNSFHNLEDMPVYPQDKLIYTFHFYDPFVFTHQGATWTDPSMGPLSEVPFPYQAAEMPPFPSSLVGSWIESAFNDYHNTGTIANMRSMMDIAVSFRDQRNVPLYCGEFGAYIPNSNNDHRVFYYQQVREYLDDKNIAWTMWDYHGGFGLYLEGGNGLFDHDLNVALLEAMEMNIPPQTPFVEQPETTGFPIYTDQIGDFILESSSNASSVNYYAEDRPNNGKYCLRWEDGTQYQYVGFDLRPNKDLTALNNQGFALDFLFRGTEPLRFDIRFLDTDTGQDDHPWRMRYTVDESIVSYDRKWHHLHIPLSEFTEGGAWEGQYYPPEGKFDWTKIDQLQIIAEYGDMGNTTLWFDNLFVTNLDTAQVLDNSVFEDLVTSVDQDGLDQRIIIYPNPASSHIIIDTGTRLLDGQVTAHSHSYQLLDVTGRILGSGDFKGVTSVDISQFPVGMYLARVFNQDGSIEIQKIFKYL
jgi:endoglucanase